MPGIKISGITNTDDAKWAAILGVEYISVSIEEESEKKVSVEMAAEIRRMLPSYTAYVLEVGDISVLSKRITEKISPAYIQARLNAENIEFVRKKAEEVSLPLIIDIDSSQNAAELEDLNYSYINLIIGNEFNQEELRQLKQKYNMEKAIIEGDWNLDNIKKACEILQPCAWSVRSVINKSPRRVDYEKMKKYIREISLW